MNSHWDMIFTVKIFKDWSFDKYLYLLTKNYLNFNNQKYYNYIIRINILRLKKTFPIF